MLQGMAFAGRGAVDVHAARVILQRDETGPHGFVVHATFPFFL